METDRGKDRRVDEKTRYEEILGTWKFRNGEGRSEAAKNWRKIVTQAKTQAYRGHHKRRTYKSSQQFYIKRYKRFN